MAKRPNLFIVGAPKCATTSLYDYLSGHPEVYFPAEKEPGFYARSHVSEEFRRTTPHLRSEAAYLALYEAAPDAAKIICDASTTYLRHRDALLDIRHHQPDAKIIACVRNPVQLVSSYYEYLRYQQWEDAPSLEEAWARQPERAEGRQISRNAMWPDSTHYASVAELGKQVSAAKEIFGDNLMVIVMEDLYTRFDEISRDVQTFLGLTYVDLGPMLSSNQARSPRLAWLTRVVRNPPTPLRQIKNGLKRLLNTHSLRIWHLVDRFNSKPVKRSISPEMEVALREYFRDDVELLERELGRNLLAEWKF